jgi:hypothetical protein
MAHLGLFPVPWSQTDRFTIFNYWNPRVRASSLLRQNLNMSLNGWAIPSTIISTKFCTGKTIILTYSSSQTPNHRGALEFQRVKLRFKDRRMSRLEFRIIRSRILQQESSSERVGILVFLHLQVLVFHRPTMRLILVPVEIVLVANNAVPLELEQTLAPPPTVGYELLKNLAWFPPVGHARACEAETPSPCLQNLLFKPIPYPNNVRTPTYLVLISATKTAANCSVWINRARDPRLLQTLTPSSSLLLLRHHWYHKFITLIYTPTPLALAICLKVIESV